MLTWKSSLPQHGTFGTIGTILGRKPLQKLLWESLMMPTKHDWVWESSKPPHAHASSNLSQILETSAPDWYKINVDAAVFTEAGQCGLGVMIRNDNRPLMGSLSKMFPYPLGAMEVEAKAVECGIIFAWEMGLKQVIVEGDSQVVIHALNRRTNTPPPPHQSSKSS